MPLPSGVRAILTDIEGTTTPVSFVYDVLFPYAEARLEKACARAGTDPEVAAAVDRLRAEHAAESAAGESVPPFGNGAAYARYLMAKDRKSTGLKALQGLIWQRGYRNGTLQGMVFPDVPAALAAWRDQGIRLRVYSSGSILAQQLLFARTDHGDLTTHFEGFHDTTTGPKKAAASYRAIAGAFGLPALEILFLSDIVAELDAAADAGMQTRLVVRPGNAPVSDHRHRQVTDFAQLLS